MNKAFRPFIPLATRVINMETMMSVARIKRNSMIATARGAPPHECENWKKAKVEIVPKTQINYETRHKIWTN